MRYCCSVCYIYLLYFLSFLLVRSEFKVIYFTLIIITIKTITINNNNSSNNNNNNNNDNDNNDSEKKLITIVITIKKVKLNIQLNSDNITYKSKLAPKKNRRKKKTIEKNKKS